MSQEPTPAELAVLLHSLGLDEYGRGEAYRSRFCAGPGHSDYPTCQALAARGLMLERKVPQVVGGVLFEVTAQGLAAARAFAPKPPKLSRGQRRYRRYLDADSSLTFGEWLKTSWARA